MLSLTECLIHPLQSNNVMRAAAYRALLLTTQGITALSTSAIIADRAADLRARDNLRTPDAVQVATPLEAKCDAFLTNVAGLKRVTEIPILVLGELTA